MLLLGPGGLSPVCLKIHRQADFEILALDHRNVALENEVLAVLQVQIYRSLFLVVHQICVFRNETFYSSKRFRETFLHKTTP